MMLMDLDYWREHKIAEKAVAFAREHPEALAAADQCALNVALRGQVTYLDAKWNYTTALARRYASASPVIIHYAGRTKPWDRPWRLPFGIYYANYSRFTPWPIDYFGGERRERGIAGLVRRAHRHVARAIPSLRRSLAWQR